MSAPSALVGTLLSVSEHEYVRFVADWITRANDLEAAPTLSGNPVVDALAAAATAHVAMTRGEHIPKWTN